mmetsp:Transcript_11588/g.38124  ORF Transcript_11588/g.38124 Transcript_11588/m.38124 type:complete len:218 (+) Transcript_11588:440-1093(+)
MSLSNVSSASRPKLSRSSATSEYASSIKRTPPRALLTTACVLSAVCPEYPATSAARSASISWPVRSTPRAWSTRARMRATVVFPVPGFPEKAQLRTPRSAGGRPWRLRSCSSASCACRARTCSLTERSPTTRESSSSASVSGVGPWAAAPSNSPAPSAPTPTPSPPLAAGEAPAAAKSEPSSVLSTSSSGGVRRAWRRVAWRLRAATSTASASRALP